MLGFIIYLAFCFGLYGMFEKLGQQGWLAFVPDVKLYVLISVCWDKSYFWIMASLSIMASVIGHLYTVNGNPLVLTEWVLETVLLGMWLFASMHVASTFGKGAFWGVLFFMLPFAVSFYFASLAPAAKTYRLSAAERMEMNRLQILS